MDAPSEALIERFRTDYLRLLTADDPQDHRIALAVSGGPDSMAMLGLAAGAFPGRVIAATVDHGLRAESADEAAIVAEACRRLRVPHQTLRIEIKLGESGNVHAWARQERYKLLQRWTAEASAGSLSTAHHIDDQAETFLMRAARASGLAGLSAIRTRQESRAFTGPITHRYRRDGALVFSGPEHRFALLRPVLGWRRHELRGAVESMQIPFVEDPSNCDPQFERARFRAWLAQAPWLDPGKIAATVEHLAALNEDLRQMSAWLWQTRSVECDSEEARLDVRDLPRGMKRYMVHMGIDHVLAENGKGGGHWTAASNVEALLDSLEAGRAATQASVLVSSKNGIWHFRMAPPRRSV